MSSKNRPGKYDCHANAEPDEPMFVLRDRDAPALVRLWALLRERAGEDAEKTEEARLCARTMELWRAENRASPDPGPGYRLLETGEMIRSTDELWDLQAGTWIETSSAGYRVGEGPTGDFYRRAVEPQVASANTGDTSEDRSRG